MAPREAQNIEEVTCLGLAVLHFVRQKFYTSGRGRSTVGLWDEVFLNCYSDEKTRLKEGLS